MFFFNIVELATYPAKQFVDIENNSSISYQFFLFLLSLEFLDFLPPLCTLACTGLHGFRERESGDMSGYVNVYVCFAFHILSTYWEVKVNMSATVEGPIGFYICKCNVSICATQGHAIFLTKELQHSVTVLRLPAACMYM